MYCSCSTNKLLFWLSLFILAYQISPAQFSPQDLPGLEMWLRADQGIDLNGNYVAQWNDQSGNGHHAASGIDVIRPTLMNDALNGLPAVSFDGADDFLAFPAVSNLRTAFWILRESPLAEGWPPRSLLGYGGGLPFLRGADESFYDPLYGSAFVRDGVTRLNFQVINGTTTQVPTVWSLVSLVTTGDVTVDNLTMDLNIYGRTWWGEFAEILIFNVPLSDEEVLQVENYLANKYGPQYEPMADIVIDYGFCDTTVCAPEGFVSYEWSNGSTEPCTSFNASGVYTLALTDDFGRTITDTISVTYPGSVYPVSSTICAGETYIWNTGLPAQDYVFDWGSGPAGPAIGIQAGGDYLLTITDNQGCTVSSAFTITVDDFPLTATLGPDVSLCSGNSIGLISGDEDGLQYLWSTDEVAPQIEINASGEYWLQAINTNNCIARDTIDIVIAGVAPEIDFNVDNPCQGASVVFNGMNISGGNITSWDWDFGDDQTASGSGVMHTYDTPGNYLVKLTVNTTEGCGNSHQEIIHIYQPPVPYFNTAQACDNQPIEFTDASFAPEGVITEVQWFIDGNSYSGSVVSVSIDEAGFQPVILHVTDNNGCFTELSGFADVQPSPVIDFSVDNQCQGGLSFFQEEIDESLTDGIVSWYWDFGDNTGSALANPSHFYPNAGEYEVNLSVTGQNNCSSSYTEVVQILQPPIADFVVSNACVDAEYFFQQSTEVTAGDPIVTWQWLIDNEATVIGEDASYAFSATGLHPVTLTVTSEHGCVSSVSQQIPVWGYPHAAFTYEPQIGEAPFEVQFINESEDATNAQWYFGDTGESPDYNPQHIFTLNGTAYVQLIVWNNAGCSDTTGQILTIASPQYDIALRDIVYQETENGLMIQARVRNTGNIQVDQILMSWQVGNDAPVLEEWNNTLMPGEESDFTFSSRVQRSRSQFPYICVKAETSPLDYTEFNLTDNEVCEPLSNTGLQIFPPYPNPGDDRMFIRFISPSSGEVELKVFDVRGNLAMEINDLEVPKGFHQYFIDISSLAVGHYKLQISMGESMGVVSFMKIDSK